MTKPKLRFSNVYNKIKLVEEAVEFYGSTNVKCGKVIEHIEKQGYEWVPRRYVNRDNISLNRKAAALTGFLKRNRSKTKLKFSLNKVGTTVLSLGP